MRSRIQDFNVHASVRRLHEGNFYKLFLKLIKYFIEQRSENCTVKVSCKYFKAFQTDAKLRILYVNLYNKKENKFPQFFLDEIKNLYQIYISQIM